MLFVYKFEIKVNHWIILSILLLNVIIFNSEIRLMTGKGGIV